LLGRVRVHPALGFGLAKRLPGGVRRFGLRLLLPEPVTLGFSLPDRRLQPLALGRRGFAFRL
jgi:hypothetical protein